MAGIVVVCPICGIEFDDDGAYGAHLADAHGLVDDEGTATTVEDAASIATRGASVPAAEPEHALVADEVLPGIEPSRIFDPNGDDARWRPISVGAAGLALLGVLCGGYFLQQATTSDGSASRSSPLAVAAEPAADRTAVAHKLADPAAAAVAVVPPPAVGPSGGEPAAPSGATDAAVPAAVADPGGGRTAPTILVPTTVPPPAGFEAPNAVLARIESCVPAGEDSAWQVSFRLSGGEGWHPAPDTEVADGGRHRVTRTAPEGTPFTLGAVQVLDVHGGLHDVALSPPVTADTCS